MRAATKSQKARSAARTAALLCAGLLAVPVAAMAQAPVSQTGGPAVKLEVGALCGLVGRMQTVSLVYGYDPADQAREVQPYAVGYTSHRDVILFGFQVGGYSKSAQNGTGDVPGWRNFRIDRIKTVNEIKPVFKPMRPRGGDHRAIAEFACKNQFAFK